MLENEKKTTKKQTILALVIEDDPDLNLLMVASLKSMKTVGFQTQSAFTLAEAVKKMNETRFEVIISDLDLPDSKGADTVKALYKQNTEVPIIAITGRYSEEFYAEVMERGAQDFLVKGEYEDETLLKVITYAIERKKAERSNKAKSDFLANMSHEVRTPLNAIIGMAEILSETKIDAEQRQYVNIITSEADSLLNIMNEILDVSKIEVQKMELESIPFDLRVAIENITDSIAYRAQQKGLEFQCTLDPNIPKKFLGDPARLRQVIMNLASNSLKFTEKGKMSIRVEVMEDTGDAAKIKFRITDTGEGIPEEKIDIIFQKFEQADGSIARKFGGTGLGLTIVRSIVELMGGEVSVKSVHGEGSEFSFWIPLKKGAAVLESDMSDELKELKGLRVILIDDNNTQLFILEDYLTSVGCQIRTANSSEEGLSMISEAAGTPGSVQLVITDMMMHGKSGYDLTRAIREDKKFDDVPIVLLSSVGERGDAKKGEQAGLNAYLTKPIKRDLLLKVIDRVIKQEKSKGEQKREFITQYSVREAKNKDLKILLVDDSLVNRQIASRHLRLAGYTVDEAENGFIALKSFTHSAYDIVLTDVQMPKMNGYDTAWAMREVEKKENRARTPIVAMTAHAMKDDYRKCIDAGMDDYITKPIRKDDMLKLVENWLSSDEEVRKKMIQKVSGRTFDEDKDKAADAIDLDAALKEFDNDKEAFKEIMAAFIESLDERIPAIKSALVDENAEVVFRESHSIKGEAGGVFAYALAKSAKDLETIGLSGKLGIALDVFGVLEKEAVRVKEFYKDRVKGQGSGGKN